MFTANNIIYGIKEEMSSPGNRLSRPDRDRLTAFLCLNGFTDESEENETNGRKPSMKIRRNFSHFSRQTSKASKCSELLWISKKVSEKKFWSPIRKNKKITQNFQSFGFRSDFEQNILVWRESPNWSEDRAAAERISAASGALKSWEHSQGGSIASG